VKTEQIWLSMSYCSANRFYNPFRRSHRDKTVVHCIATYYWIDK